MKRYQNLNFNRLSRQFRHGAGNDNLSQNCYNKKTRKSLTESLVRHLLLHLIFINVFILNFNYYTVYWNYSWFRIIDFRLIWS